MSLRKSNGTITVQVKKRYLSNGTTQKQVKKKYKSDGTSLELVYSAGEALFPDQYASWVKGTVKNGGNGVISQSELYVNSSNNTSDGAIGSVRFSNLVDITPYSTITAKIRYKTPQYGSWGNAKFGLSKVRWLGCWYGSNEGVVDSSPWTRKTELPATSLQWQEKTFTLNVSDLTDSFYLKFACFGGLQNAEMHITDIILE